MVVSINLEKVLKKCIIREELPMMTREIMPKLWSTIIKLLKQTPNIIVPTIMQLLFIKDKRKCNKPRNGITWLLKLIQDTVMLITT